MAEPLIDFDELLKRAIAICTEITPKADGVPYWMHTQGIYPFFIAKVEPVRFDEDSEEVDEYQFDIRIRHISGNRTGGYKGEAERRLNQQVPPILRAFRSRTLLQSSAYPEEPDWLEEAILIEGGGVSVFDASALGGDAMQLGCDYILRVRVRMKNEQEYS